MKGKVVAIGDLNIDGEDLQGVFIECTVEELRGGRNMFAEEVEILPAENLKKQ